MRGLCCNSRFLGCHQFNWGYICRYELADLLNSRFVLGGEVNRLGAEDLRFLCAKLFHNQEIPQNLEDKQNKKLVIKWAQFYRGLVPGKNFTFWEWFYEITELMHDATSGENIL